MKFLLSLLALSLTAATPVLAGGSCCAGWGTKSASAKTAKQDIVTTAVEAGQFQTLAAALMAADLVDALQMDGPFTVFAPTDEAFAKLPEGTVESLLKPENRDQLVAILKYHVVPGEVLAKDVSSGAVNTLEGNSIAVQLEDGKVMINDAKVIQTDVLASNGVIHVVDTVLIPTTPKS